MPVGTADWAYIKRRWEEGLSAPAIEKEILQPNGKPAVTRQAILKRANKEGWLQGSRGSMAVTKGGSTPSSAGTSELSDAEALAAQWAPTLAGQLEANGKTAVSPERIERALVAYARGGNHTMAAAFAAMSPDTWQRYRADLPALEQAILEVQAAKASKHLERIDKAGKRGDWKADEALLKANPLTRGDWQQDKGGGQGVAIQINFGSGMPSEAMKIIDG